jgi:hypothetical protein
MDQERVQQLVNEGHQLHSAQRIAQLEASLKQAQEIASASVISSLQLLIRHERYGCCQRYAVEFICIVHVALRLLVLSQQETHSSAIFVQDRTWVYSYGPDRVEAIPERQRLDGTTTVERPRPSGSFQDCYCMVQTMMSSPPQQLELLRRILCRIVIARQRWREAVTGLLACV